MKHWNKDNIGYSEFLDSLTKSGLKHEPYADGIDVKNDDWQDDFAKILEKSEEGESEVGGTSLKFFTRIDDRKDTLNGDNKTVVDSKYFGELISELRNNPNCSYKTIYDDLIKSGYNPKFFSALIKDCHGVDDKVLSEVAFSRIANLLNIPTNFTVAIKNPKDDVEKKYLGIASIDYLEYGKESKMLCDIIPDDRLLSYHSASLYDWIGYIDRCIEKLSPNGVNQGDRDKTIKNFIKSFILRSGIFPDNDLSSYNVGLIQGKDGIEMLPNTDAEGCVQGVALVYGYDHLREGRIERILEYCHDFYPEVMQEFMGDLQNAIESKSLENILLDIFNPNELTPKSRLISNKQLVDDILKTSKFTLNFYNEIKDIKRKTYFQM